MAYVPLGERDEWKDVSPVPQDDGPNPLVQIMYSEEYRDAMDYFRAVSAADEYSDRVLDLTEAILHLNPSHYTVWQYRFKALMALKKDLQAELDLMKDFAREHLKTYQVWHHRLLLMTNISPEDPADEIEFIHAALGPDPKNYHTWAYLHWLYCHFSELGRISDARWKEELEWCEGMLAADGRNNSAWGWRWFLCMARSGARGAEEGGKQELEYTLKQIHHIPHNASAWNYLRGVIRALGVARGQLVPALSPYMAGSAISPPTKASSSWLERDGPLNKDTPTPIALALEFQADALVEEGRLGDAAAVFAQLGTEVDQMRGAYWEMRRGECEA